MPEIDRLLPKPIDEMKIADVIQFMEKVSGKLIEWSANHPTGKAKIDADTIIEAMQAVAWGTGAYEFLRDMPTNDGPEYDEAEAVFYIRNRTGLPDDVIKAVLAADELYMIDKGIIEQDPTPGAAPVVQ